MASLSRLPPLLSHLLFISILLLLLLLPLFTSASAEDEASSEETEKSYCGTISPKDQPRTLALSSAVYVIILS